MLDKLIEKLVESTVSGFTTKLEGMAEARKAELMDIKFKIRDNPEEVEEWFDKEIQKLDRMDIKELLDKQLKNATAGI